MGFTLLIPECRRLKQEEDCHEFLAILIYKYEMLSQYITILKERPTNTKPYFLYLQRTLFNFTFRLSVIPFTTTRMNILYTQKIHWVGLVMKILLCLSKNSLCRQTINSVECITGMNVSIYLKAEPSLHKPLSIWFAIKKLSWPIRLQCMNDTKKAASSITKTFCGLRVNSVCSHQGDSTHSPLCMAQRGAPPTFRPQAARQQSTQAHTPAKQWGLSDLIILWRNRLERHGKN